MEEEEEDLPNNIKQIQIPETSFNSRMTEEEDIFTPICRKGRFTRFSWNEEDDSSSSASYPKPTSTPTKRRKSKQPDQLYSLKNERFREKHNQQKKEEEEEEGSRPLSTNPQLSLAMYIAMAHAGLALSLALLYGVIKLLEEYWRPIQWAILCSMPLRELQTTLVRFWSYPLQLGLFETLLAVPLAILRSAIGSVIDSQIFFFGLIRRKRTSSNDRIGFSKIMQWLISFGLFIIFYERIGTALIPLFAIPGFIAYAAGFGQASTPGVATTLSVISSSVRSGRPRLRPPPSPRSILSRLSRSLTFGILKRLNNLVAIGLIMFMIVGSVSGFSFFCYKITIEGKDAMVSLQKHLEENNYAERMGIKQWMDENNVPELIDTYTTKFYETVSQQIDTLALHYNATEFVEGFQHLLIRPLWESFSNTVTEKVQPEPISEKFYRFQLRVWNGEWKVIYGDFNRVFRELLLVSARDDLVGKIRSFVLQSVDVSKRVFASSTMVLAGSANLVISIGVSIVSGAAGLLNFISQLTVFFWLLYYLIASNSEGVMGQMLEMLPVSKLTRVRCAEVLDHAVSSVLLATVKVTLFQGCLTYLLFRFYQIHFLYVSTFIAFMSALLPITPTWLSSIPAAAQLAMESKYIQAVLLTVVHLLLLDYGTSAIQDEIPGQNAYLTGLSILGGMALFQNPLEGAIMGPLLITVMITVKNLYAEFVLASGKETRGHSQMNKWGKAAKDQQ